jgi:hypothetical protein
MTKFPEGSTRTMSNEGGAASGCADAPELLMAWADAAGGTAASCVALGFCSMIVIVGDSTFAAGAA